MMWTKRVRTGCIDKGIMVFCCQEGIREIAEKLLQEASYTVYVVIEVFGVSKVQSGVG